MLTVKRTEITSAGLHILAMTCMFCDHLWGTVVPGHLWLTCVGRLAFPIFAFLLAEGFRRTSDRKKYALRLLKLAVISHFAYNFCFGIPFIPFHTSVFNQTGVVWSLAWGLVLLWVFDASGWKQWQQTEKGKNLRKQNGRQSAVP